MKHVPKDEHLYRLVAMDLVSYLRPQTHVDLEKIDPSNTSAFPSLSVRVLGRCCQVLC